MNTQPLHIQDEDIIQKLTSIAKLQQRTIEAVLRDWIDEYEAYLHENPLLQMIQSADELGLVADRDDISEHFDELLYEAKKHEYDNQK